MSNKEDLGQTGIYMIRNIVNGKMYIGQTMVSFRERWTHHRYQLNKGTHRNYHLQSSWNKHGHLKFAFNILEIHDNLDDCNEAEERLILKHRALSTQHGYNILLGGNNREMQQETKDKIELSWLIKSQTDEIEAINKPKPFGYRLITPMFAVKKYQEWEDYGFIVFDVVNNNFDDTMLIPVDNWKFIDDRGIQCCKLNNIEGKYTENWNLQ